MDRPKEKRRCKVCGRMVTGLSRRMCGKCYRVWQRDNFPPNAVCEVCGKLYFRRPSASPRGRTCSRDCFRIWKVGRNQHNRPTDGAIQIERVCEWCRKKFNIEKRQADKGYAKFCSSRCYGMSRRHDPTCSKYPENAWRQREGFRKLSDRILSDTSVRCAICDTPRIRGNLVVHHIVEPNGDVNLLLSEDNLQVLCRACHMRVHFHGLERAVA